MSNAHVDSHGHQAGPAVSGHGAGHAHAAGHGGGHGGGHGHGEGGIHLSLGGYVTGFIAAVILTAIPFYLVMGKTFSSNVTAAVILAFAAVQIVVHMIYFLHLDPKSEGGWNLLALLFTVMLVVIALSGSLWVMYHLNHNMMPGSMTNMSNMP